MWSVIHADIDECVEEHGVCQPLGRCVNIPGSYRCSCPPGYEPDDTGNKRFKRFYFETRFNVVIIFHCLFALINVDDDVGHHHHHHQDA